MKKYCFLVVIAVVLAVSVLFCWSQASSKQDSVKYSVFWQTDTLLHIESSDGVSENLTFEAARQKYADNAVVQCQLDGLKVAQRQLDGLKVARRNRRIISTIKPTAGSRIVSTSHLSTARVSSNPVAKANLSLRISSDIIETELLSILDELDLTMVSSDDVMAQLSAALKIHRYIAKTNVYHQEIMGEKEQCLDLASLMVYDLYQAVVLKRSVCTSNSLEMVSLLDKIGIKAYCVGLENTLTGSSHMANLVRIGKFWYYFDATLERTIHGDTLDWNTLLAAGLGSDLYGEMYTICCVLNNGEITDAPDDIDKQIIPRPVITMLLAD